MTTEERLTQLEKRCSILEEQNRQLRSRIIPESEKVTSMVEMLKNAGKSRCTYATIRKNRKEH